MFIEVVSATYCFSRSDCRDLPSLKNRRQDSAGSATRVPRGNSNHNGEPHDDNDDDAVHHYIEESDGGK